MTNECTFVLIILIISALQVYFITVYCYCQMPNTCHISRKYFTRLQCEIETEQGLTSHQTNYRSYRG